MFTIIASVNKAQLAPHPIISTFSYFPNRPLLLYLQIVHDITHFLSGVGSGNLYSYCVVRSGRFCGFNDQDIVLIGVKKVGLSPQISFVGTRKLFLLSVLRKYLTIRSWYATVVLFSFTLFSSIVSISNWACFFDQLQFCCRDSNHVSPIVKFYLYLSSYQGSIIRNRQCIENDF